MTTTIERVDAVQRVAQHRLERAGWTILSANIDLTRETARLELRSSEGRVVTLDCRSGKATITREQAEERTVVVGRRGDRFPARAVGHRFLGRERFPSGVRTALRYLSHYLVENAPLVAGKMHARDGLRLLLGGPIATESATTAAGAE